MKKRFQQLKYIRLSTILKAALIFSILLFIFSNFLFRSIHIDGHSMEPTLSEGELAFSNIIALSTSDLERFEIVVIGDEEEGQMVKRIIAMPNETIQFKDDKLYINGKYMEEPFLDETYISTQTMNHRISFTQDFGPITLQEDEYFVLGDNRLVSKDSRVLGAFKTSAIIGKHVIVFYPFNKIRIEGSN